MKPRLPYSPSRDTLVIEQTFPNAIGSDEKGARMVKQYLSDLATHLQADPVAEPQTHLSPKYGFSGWMPLSEASAIHLYAWDERGRATAPFVSVDISTPSSVQDDVRQQLLRFTRECFGAEESHCAWKTISANEHWRELAPHILRQRMSIAGKTRSALPQDAVYRYLQSLCDVLEMDQISEPLIVDSESTAWMHWETSGVIAHWGDENFSTDIYTCKAFSPDDAIEHTREALQMVELNARSF